MYDERYKDIVAERVVNTHDVTEGRIVSTEVYGRTLDGRRVWVSIQLAEDTVFASNYADDEGSIPIPPGSAGYVWRTD